MYVEAHGAISIEPNKMAALAPAIVMVKGFRNIESCFDIRDLTRAEGINRGPTAGSSASFQTVRVILTFNKLRVVKKSDTGEQ